MERKISGPPGTVELWQDSRITHAIRKLLWGTFGGNISYGLEENGHKEDEAKFPPKDPARNALIVLRDSKGAVVAQERLDRVLADMDPLWLGAAQPTFLVSVDYNAGTGDSAFIDKRILNVDVARKLLEFAHYAGPESIRVRLPNGKIAERQFGSEHVVEFSNHAILTVRSGGTADITSTGCRHDGYMDPTNGVVYASLSYTILYYFDNNLWHRTVEAVFNGCDA
jgi:hypothetical protein